MTSDQPKKFLKSKRQLSRLILVNISRFTLSLRYIHPFMVATSRLSQLQNFISPNMSSSKVDMPLSGVATDGWHKDGRATATCFCGAIQLSFVS